MVSGSLGEKNGVTSVILLPRKTVISLAAIQQFAGYNTLFHNHDANPIKPNTNSNHKTDLA